MHHTEETIFTDRLTTSSFVECIIETSSKEIKEKLNKILTSFDKDSPFDSSKDASNISVKSSPFDSFHLCLSHQEVIASTKGERCLELGNEPFYLKET